MDAVTFLLEDNLEEEHNNQPYIVHPKCKVLRVEMHRKLLTKYLDIINEIQNDADLVAFLYSSITRHIFCTPIDEPFISRDQMTIVLLKQISEFITERIMMYTGSNSATRDKHYSFLCENLFNRPDDSINLADIKAIYHDDIRKAVYKITYSDIVPLDYQIHKVSCKLAPYFCMYLMNFVSGPMIHEIEEYYRQVFHELRVDCNPPEYFNDMLLQDRKISLEDLMNNMDLDDEDDVDYEYDSGSDEVNEIYEIDL